jgi:hypothetical protein
MDQRGRDQILMREWITQIARNVRELRTTPVDTYQRIDRLHEERDKLHVICKVARRQARMLGAPNIRGSMS